MAIPFAASQVLPSTEMNELARAHWRKTTAKQVVNTVTETDLLNAEITIDAGAMSTNRMLRLTAEGDCVNNSGATQASMRFKLKLGATTLLDTNAIAASWAATTTRGAWKIVAEIANLGAANSQWSTLVLDLFDSLVNNVLAGFATGQGAWGTGTNNNAHGIGSGASAVDTTAAQALALTVILPAASASLDVTLKYAVVELV